MSGKIHTLPGLYSG